MGKPNAWPFIEGTWVANLRGDLVSCQEREGLKVDESWRKCRFIKPSHPFSRQINYLFRNSANLLKGQDLLVIKRWQLLFLTFYSGSICPGLDLMFHQ